MPPTFTVACPRHADLLHQRPRITGRPAHRTALTAILRRLALVAVAALAILHFLPAALHAAAL